MASVVIAGDTSGTVTLAAPAVAGTTTLTLPTANGTILTTGSSGQSIPKAALPTGSVLQVVSTTKTDTFSTSSTSFTDVTGFSVSITPTSSTSKILIICNITGTATGALFSVQGRLVRNSTAIAIGDASGSRTQASYMWEGAQEANFGISTTYLDSPATTSSTTYKIQLRTNNGSYTTYVNRATTDTDSSAYARTASTITVMEIAA